MTSLALSLGVALWLHGADASARWLLSAQLLAGAGAAGSAVVAWWFRAKEARVAAGLVGAAQDAPLSESLDRLADRLRSVEHRVGNSHPVTGLPTREKLLSVMQADVSEGARHRLLGAIRFLDFDRLAAFDPPAADRALAQFAKRLARATKALHVFGQIDRDCFAVWFSEDDHAAAIAEFRSLVYVASQQMADGDGCLTPTIEAGAVAWPADSADPAQLLLRAQVSLARPQPSHTGAQVPTRLPSAEEAREAFLLEQSLAQAIAEEQLTMAFQPVIDLSKSRLIGAEALLRWDHPVLGPVSPARFIPVVEKIGLSDRFGMWVLNAACREARIWRDLGLRGMRVAVNLSARQLDDPRLPAKITRTLARHGLDPRALELELTETAATADAARTNAIFTELRQMGISLSIDDFGSGYSSMSYLKNLSFDKLKIDREFVVSIDTRRDSRAICKALVELGRGLGLTVLAEGVETAAEVATLRAMGCDIFQGYFFGKPLSGEAFRALASDPAAIRALHHRLLQPTPLDDRLTA